MSRSTKQIVERSLSERPIEVEPRQNQVGSMVRALRRLGTGKVALMLAALAATITSSGCHNPFAIYQHRTTGYDFHGQPNVAFYHYPHGSWFIPAQQTKHCPTVVEAPFHGFQATCWTQWPEPWTPCPPPGMHYPVTEGEVIEAPPHDATPMPEPAPTNKGAHDLPLQDPAAQAVSKPAARMAQRPSRPPVQQPPVEKPSVEEEPARQEPTPAVRPKSATPARPFAGKHGFSAPADDGLSSAAAIELPVRKASHDDEAPQKSEPSATKLRELLIGK